MPSDAMSGLPAKLSRTPTASVSTTLNVPPEAELGRCHNGSACTRGRAVNQRQASEALAGGSVEQSSLFHDLDNLESCWPSGIAMVLESPNHRSAAP
ncbi:hypothetical protein D3C75_1163230 [compost metagenome]